MRMIAILTLAALALSACNTVKGIGRDLESAANAVEDAFN